MSPWAGQRRARSPLRRQAVWDTSEPTASPGDAQMSPGDRAAQGWRPGRTVWARACTGWHAPTWLRGMGVPHLQGEGPTARSTPCWGSGLDRSCQPPIGANIPSSFATARPPPGRGCQELDAWTPRAGPLTPFPQWAILREPPPGAPPEPCKAGARVLLSQVQTPRPRASKPLPRAAETAEAGLARWAGPWTAAASAVSTWAALSPRWPHGGPVSSRHATTF